MSIYKQIIFLALLLIVVMGLCVFIHIDDFNDLESENRVIVVEKKTEHIEEKKDIIEVATPKAEKEEIIKVEKTKKIEVEKVSQKEELKDKVEKRVILPVIKEVKTEKIVKPIKKENVLVKAKNTQKQLDKITSKQKIHFKRLSTDVTTKSYKLIEEISKFLKDNKNVKIEIGGHTDAKGKDDVNKWVSLQRALSVKKELIKLGVDKKRIKAKGYGESKPLVPNDKNGYSTENRRVEFKIIEE